MNLNILKRLSYLLVPALFLLPLIGCQKSQAKEGIEDKPEVINATIGSIAVILQRGILEVRGFGLVAGLNGTGSSECPEELRKKLIAQIKVETHDLKGVNPKAFINSKNTAVVEVRGIIPPIASKGDVFDIRVAPLASTQTSSLEGGRLFTTKLVKHEQIVIFSRHLTTQALAEGPIYVNKLSDRKPETTVDYVISGGRAVRQVNVTMLLKKSNYFTARLITDLINDKFDIGTANAKGPGEILINIPPKYRYEKQKFLAMIRSIYLTNNPKLKQDRINSLVQDMASNEDKLTPEIALEVTGKPALNAMAPLLNHPDEAVRFHVARCMLNIGDIGYSRALKTLKEILENKNSRFRVEAIKAVGRGAKKNNAITLLRSLINSEDFKISQAVYDEMRKLRAFGVSRSAVAGDFYLDTVLYRGENRIYVSRKGTPKIVIFGEGMKCAKDVYVKSSNEAININARYGDKYVSIWRNNPKKSGVIGPLKSTYSVEEIIKTLGELPKVSAASRKLPGLAVPYYEICALLEQMCKTGAIDAEFIAGDLPDFPDRTSEIQPEITPGVEYNAGYKFRTTPKKDDTEPVNPDEWQNLLDDKKPKKEDDPKNTNSWKDLL